MRDAIKKALLEYGPSCHVYHASEASEIGHPDLYGTHKGRAYFFEVKTPGWKPKSESDKIRAARQKIWLNREKKHGAIVGFVHSAREAIALLEDKVVDKSLDNDSVSVIGFSL